MKKHLFLTALLGGLSIVSCNNDPVKEDAPPVILPVKITYTERGEKQIVTYKYDSQNRFTSIKSIEGNLWFSTTFTYDNESLTHITLKENNGYRCDYSISYKENEVFIESSSFFPDYPNSPPDKSLDTLSINSEKYFITGENGYGGRNTCSYDVNGNIVQIKDINGEMMYDSKNGMYKNVNAEPWVFVYFIRRIFIENFHNYKNNCIKIKAQGNYLVNYTMIYNNDEYPIKIYGDNNTLQLIEYSTVN